MGNENERKRNPAENRQRQMGHPFDDAKTGGDEETVGVANDPGFGEGGGPTSTTVGTVGIIGGSADFLTDGEEPTGQGSTAGVSDEDGAEAGGSPTDRQGSQ